MVGTNQNAVATEPSCGLEEEQEKESKEVCTPCRPSSSSPSSDSLVISPPSMNVDIDAIAGHMKEILKLCGEDPDRPGLHDTPHRYARAMSFLTQGYRQTVSDVVGRGVFAEEGLKNMVLVRDIQFCSMCEHHLLPFFGTVDIGYIPDKKILGLSKFARITQMFSRRLQVQERLCQQIADAICDAIDPVGVGVVIRGKHMCMMMRGVEKTTSDTITSCMMRCFRRDARTRAEFMNLISNRSTF